MAKVYCWGNTSNGELGLGGIEDEHILLPRKQKLVVDRRKYSLRQLSSGRNHTLVLLHNHIHDTSLLLSCGSNERHQLGREGSWRRLEVIDALSHHVVTQVCCGANHSLALTTAGQIFSWGCNLFGQLGIGNNVDESVDKPSLVKRLAAECIVQIVCGGNHSLALTKNGILYSWGSNAFGQLGNGQKGNCENSPIEIQLLRSVPIRQLSCGGSHSAVLSYTGALYMWGKNEFGQLGLNDLQNRCLPTIQTTLRSQRISFINCGDEHSVALTADGGLFSWGAGMYGQLGHAKNNNEILPRRVFELMGNTVTQVSCGRCHTLASVEPSGRVYSFGLNGSGQLGIGTQVSKSVPNSVMGKWIELGVKDISLRNMSGSVLPVTKHKSFPSPTVTPKRSQTPTKDIDIENYVRDDQMSIEEFSDGDETEADLSSDEMAIIEEPEDINKICDYRKPEFICTDNGIVSTNADSLQIDEYISDPDSDTQLNTERQQLVLKEIIASKGDQSFVLVVRLSDRNRPLDFRYNYRFEEIYKLDNNKLKELNESLEGEKIQTDDIEYIENALTSVSCWNSSYIDLNTKSETLLPAIDWESAQKGFNFIEKTKNSRIQELIYQSILKLIPNLPNIYDENSLDPEVLRIYLLLPLFHLFKTGYKDRDIMRQLVAGYLRSVLRLNDFALNAIKEWFSRLDEKLFKQFIQNVKNYVKELLDIQDKQNIGNENNERHEIDATLHECLGLSLEFMAIMNKVNEKHNIISYKEFYIEGISDHFNVGLDYKNWLETRFHYSRQTHGRKALFLCDFAFIFDPPAKTEILAADSQLQQSDAAISTMMNPILFGNTILIGNPYLVLTVSRNSILHETINYLVFRNQNPRDFKKPLKVNFEGEEGVDAGIGMKKEFFLLLMKEVLDKKYGMFCEYIETNTIWFNPGEVHDSDDLVMYHLIGIICGLAIYNQVIIYLPFPLILYKKLLNEPLELDDLNSLDPVLTKSLKDIEDTTYNENEFNAIYGDMNFTITLNRYDFPVEYELEKGGKNKILNYKNRKDYVKLYWNYILNESVKMQFKEFKEGFYKVLSTTNKDGNQDSGIMSLFRAEELMQLITGQEVIDWKLMETHSTKYKEPFNSQHQTIKMFWKVFHSLTNTEKKKFLLFLTGSDRIPILGMKAVNIIIQPMKTSEEHLPVSHTCFNVLDLPENYSSEDKLRQKLLLAIEHIHSFTLA